MMPDEKYSIPRFALYGDDNQHLQPDFVHIEDIADRSLKHDWKIKPHRHGKLFQLLFLDNGRAELCLDEENHRLNGNWVITIPPGTVHGFCFPADTEGMVLTMLDTLVEDRDPNMHSFLSQLLLQPYRLRLHSSDVLFRQLLQYLLHIKQELNSTHYGQVQMLKYLVKMVLINISRQLESHPQSEQSNNGRQQLLNQFRHLLETNYPQHWTVQQYAQALHTSTSSLNRVCLELLGVTAKELIQDRMLIEIKRRLIYTRQPLDSIAYTLGYKDPSYFSRFFKNREGVSPGHYRQQKYHETETS
jgi:AraC family transcriptional regulator, transcriptional activator of pobA